MGIIITFVILGVIVIGIHEMPALLFARPMGYTNKPLLQISEEEKKYDGIRF